MSAAKPNVDILITAAALFIYTEDFMAVENFMHDQTAVDGGHVYSLQVTDRKKGTAGEHVSVRAGGFFYRVALNKGDSVLVFLNPAHTSRFSSGTSAKPGGGQCLGRCPCR